MLAISVPEASSKIIGRRYIMTSEIQTNRIRFRSSRVVIGLLLLSQFLSPSNCAADKPNILIVLTDDMGFSDLGCFGGEIETPNLDALAAGGMRFTEFYNTARCWPTRATLMTGRYEDKLRDEHVTIAEVLKPAGYRTGMVGKWHLSGNPIDRGFETYYGNLSGAASYWNPSSLTRGKKRVKPDSPDYYYTDKIGSEAVAQLEEFSKTPNTPFFQYIAFTAAHWPLHAPESTIQKYVDRYQGGWEKLRADRYERMLELGVIDRARWPLPEPEEIVEDWASADHKDWRIRNMAIYAAIVDHMDQAMGRVIGALKRNGQFENTFIVYMHDNGGCSEHLEGNAHGAASNIIALAEEAGKTVTVGDHYDVSNGPPFTFGSIGQNWANAQNTPLRRYKANVHEGGACTPAIVHWPAGIKTPGVINRQRGHVVDLMATCLDLAGADYPLKKDGQPVPEHEGRSLLAAISGGKYEAEHTYYFNHNGTHAVIKGDWKVVRERESDWHLYNLAKEKTEMTNLAADYPSRVAELSGLWDKKFGESISARQSVQKKTADGGVKQQ